MPRPCLAVQVVRETSSTVAAGRTIRTEPTVGTEVAPGSQVTLVIAQAPPVSKTIVADADTYWDPAGTLYIVGHEPDYGHGQSLVLSNISRTASRGAAGQVVIHFDLAGISSKAKIQEAVLLLYIEKVSDETGHKVVIEPVAVAWSEDSRDRPDCDTGVQLVGEAAGVGRYKWDVTDIVQQQVSGARKNLGICLVLPARESSTALVFTSREGTTRQRPTLSITYMQ